MVLAARSRVYRDPSDVNSRSGSEVELAQAKANPLGVRIVHVRIGVETGAASGNRGDISLTPMSPER